MIDLRSDTVTKPTPAMRRAMAEAEVGDDVLGDDPTVIALERRAAELLGKQAAVYMPSGTMTNQAAIRAHTEPGDEILVHAQAHLFYYEAGAPAALSGVTCHLLDGERGIFTAEAVRAARRPQNLHFPRTKLLCVENTHNRGGGSVWPIDRLRDVCAAAGETNLATHLDGARIWNAAVATGVSVREIAEPFDTISVCFSKGLGAPVGSALVGSEGLIARARRFRKMFGGAMRQAGIIAAGAMYALEHHRERLADDHANARRLAERLAGLKGIEIDPASVETNIVLVGVNSMPAGELVSRLAEWDVACLATGPSSVRLVTNLMVTEADVDTAMEAFGEALST